MVSHLTTATRMLLMCSLAFLSVVTAFSNKVAFTSHARNKIPSTSTVYNRHAPRTRLVLSMAEDDSANNLPFLDDDVGSPSSDSAGNVLSESFVESVVMPDKTIVVQGVAGLDSPALPSPISSSQETDFAKKLVESALSDPSTVDHIDNESGIATDIPTTTADQVILDDMISSSETVSALLAASEEAAAAAEAKLSAEEAKMVPPLIPTSQNGTFGDATISVQEIPDILPASQVVGEPITAVPTEIETPNVKKILKFAIPAIGVWLCGPLLSLIDTSAVGLFSGTYQQAALNPAVAVTDYAALLIVSCFARSNVFKLRALPVSLLLTFSPENNPGIHVYCDYKLGGFRPRDRPWCGRKTSYDEKVGFRHENLWLCRCCLGNNTLCVCSNPASYHYWKRCH
jgi:hypothetical protein